MIYVKRSIIDDLIGLLCLLISVWFAFIGFAGLRHIFSGSALNPMLDIFYVSVCFSISALIIYGRKWMVTKNLRYKKKRMRKEAYNREVALDYSTAINLWEDLEEFEEVARVRKLQFNLISPNVNQTIIQGDQVNKTEVKDSVINKSNIGSDNE